MLDTTILNYQSLLHPESPVEVTSEDIKPYLKELGWNEGDMLPAGMQDYTAAVLKYLGKAVSMRNIDFFFKNETVRATLASAINKVKLTVNEAEMVDNKVKELVPNMDTLHEGTAETIKEVATQIAKKEIKEQESMAIQEATITGLEEVPTTEDVIEEPVKEVKQEVPYICPRCGFDCRSQYIPFPVTEDDKISYVYSIIGGSQFEKKYDIADGLLSITYRTPTTAVNRMVEDQLKIDSSTGKILTTEQYITKSLRYSLAINLARVTTNHGMDNNLPVPDIHDGKFKLENNTNLVKFTEYVEDNIIKSSTREALFRQTFNEFIQLQLFLQNKIKEENFMKAVLDKGF